MSYTSGSVTVTTAALPDVDSEIIFSWGKKANTFNRSDLVIAPPAITYTLTNPAVVAGSLTIRWSVGGTAKTATANNNGVISGDAVGTVNHVTGKFTFSPTVTPPANTVFSFTYDYGNKIEEVFPHPIRNADGKLAIQLANPNVKPNSIEVEWNTVQDTSLLETFQETVVTKRQWVDPIIIERDDGTKLANTVSSIDYALGKITFNPDRTVKLPAPKLNKIPLGSTSASETARADKITTVTTTTVTTYRNVFVGFEYFSIPAIYPNDDSGVVKVRYRAADTSNTTTETLTMPNLSMDLTPNFAETIVYGSVQFSLGGKTYFDRNGQLYTDLDRATGAATLAGSLDYASGVATLNFWSPNQSSSVALKSLLTDITIAPVDMVTFRTPAAPIKQGSLQIRATTLEGNAINATADMDGVLNTASVTGSINYDTGVAKIRFGAWIDAAGHESESWFNPEAVVESKIFKPAHVLAESIVYNAVSYTYIPLSSSILGLDPVRLPPDGRVPIYSIGDVAVILNDQTTVGTFANGATTNLNRVRLAKVTVKDHAGNMIAVDKYSVNLDTGIITWQNLSGVSQPLTIVDRIEDMGVVTDVQITGELTLSQPISHAFPIENTLVSNAVVHGTIYARVSVPFDQQTWTNVWSDSVIGSTVAAQYNASQYPIVVDNHSAIQERWALIFTTATLFNVIGEHVGQIVTGANINTDTAPINPNTNQPYFTIPSGGWGSGWSAGNVLRFNTYAANAPVWIIQSIGQGAATDPDFTFCIEARGDIDNVA